MFREEDYTELTLKTSTKEVIKKAHEEKEIEFILKNEQEGLSGQGRRIADFRQILK